MEDGWVRIKYIGRQPRAIMHRRMVAGDTRDISVDQWKKLQAADPGLFELVQDAGSPESEIKDQEIPTLESLGLSARIMQTLSDAEIHTVESLAKIAEAGVEGLMDIPGVGKATATAILQALEEYREF